jgi:putative salt-induced outer membrane protein YdiY
MKRLIWAAVALLVISVSAYADEIVLKNGDTIHGTVTGAGGGKVTLATGYAGDIQIAVGEIQSITTEGDVSVHLVDGQILTGTLATKTEGTFQVTSEKAGTSGDLAWSDVDAFNPPPTEWSGSVNIGTTIQSGNTDRITTSVGAAASRETDEDRFSLRFLFNYAEEDEVRTARNTYGSIKYDRFFSPRAYGYLAVEMLSDEFRDLDMRSQAGAGGGYIIIEEADLKFEGELGLAYVSENYDVASDESELSVRLAGNFSWSISGTLKFTDALVLFPSLEESEYTARNVATLSTALGAGWSLTFSNILEYDSDPPAGIAKTDRTWILGLQYSF